MSRWGTAKVQHSSISSSFLIWSNLLRLRSFLPGLPGLPGFLDLTFPTVTLGAGSCGSCGPVWPSALFSEPFPADFRALEARNTLRRSKRGQNCLSVSSSKLPRAIWGRMICFSTHSGVQYSGSSAGWGKESTRTSMMSWISDCKSWRRCFLSSSSFRCSSKSMPDLFRCASSSAVSSLFSRWSFEMRKTKAFSSCTESTSSCNSYWTRECWRFLSIQSCILSIESFRFFILPYIHISTMHIFHHIPISFKLLSAARMHRSQEESWRHGSSNSLNFHAARISLTTSDWRRRSCRPSSKSFKTSTICSLSWSTTA